MTSTSKLSKLRACMLALCALFVSACGISPPDAYVQGSRPLKADEYVSRYAGNSIRFDVTSDGQGKYREMYFGKDGTFQAVDMYRDIILEGKWAINSPLGDSGNMNLNFGASGISEGQAFRNNPSFGTMYVYVLPDGTASVFTRTSSGADISRQPKPTPGFQSRARFNSIKRKVSNALGS